MAKSQIGPLSGIKKLNKQQNYYTSVPMGLRKNTESVYTLLIYDSASQMKEINFNVVYATKLEILRCPRVFEKTLYLRSAPADPIGCLRLLGCSSLTSLGVISSFITFISRSSYGTCLN